MAKGRYGSLIWMYCTRKENNRINRLHERVLRIIYDDCDSSFEELLARDGAVTCHVRNIRKVAIEMYKVFYGISPEVRRDLFTFIDGSVSGRKFERKRDITVFYGELSLSSFGPIVWNEMLPDSYKKCKDIKTFKREIKKWVPQCHCRLCRRFVAGVGFVNVAN